MPSSPSLKKKTRRAQTKTAQIVISKDDEGFSFIVFSRKGVEEAFRGLRAEDLPAYLARYTWPAWDSMT